MKRIDERYLAKLKWSPIQTFQSKLGPRLWTWAPVTQEHVEDYRAQEANFLPWSIKLKEHPPQSGQYVFVQWGIDKAELKKREKLSLEMSKAHSSSVEVPAPPGLVYMPFQLAGIDYALSRKSTLIGDEMGLGKTVEAIGFINAMNARAGKRVLHKILLVCPADLRLNWIAELHRWLVDRYSIAIAEERCFPSSDIVIISYQSLRLFKDDLIFYWDLIIADECHYCSNPDSQMTRVMCGGREKRKRIKGVTVTIHEMCTGLTAKWKIAMTGTPITNRPKNIWPIIHWLDPASWPKWWEFATKFCGYTHLNPSCDGATNTHELGILLRESVMIRRLKSDVLKDLPPKRRSVHVLPIDKQAMEEIGILNRSPKMERWMDQIVASKVRYEFAKADDVPGCDPYEIVRAKTEFEAVMEKGGSCASELFHLIGLAKIPSAVEVIRRAVDETPKIVIYVHHKDVLKELASHFPGMLAINSDTPLPDRHAYVSRFQNDPHSGPIGVSLECAKGITLTASTVEYFLEGSWKPGVISQAEDRCHRIGQKDTVNVIHLVVEGSIDIVRSNRMIQKQNVIEQILDNAQKQNQLDEPIIPLPGVSLNPYTIDKEAAELDLSLVQTNLVQLEHNSALQESRVDYALYKRLVTGLDSGQRSFRRRALLLHKLHAAFHGREGRPAPRLPIQPRETFLFREVGGQFV